MKKKGKIVIEHHSHSPILLPCLEINNLFSPLSSAYKTNDTEEIILCYLFSGTEKAVCLLCSLIPSIFIRIKSSLASPSLLLRGFHWLWAQDSEYSAPNRGLTYTLNTITYLSSFSHVLKLNVPKGISRKFLRVLLVVPFFTGINLSALDVLIFRVSTFT